MKSKVKPVKARQKPVKPAKAGKTPARSLQKTPESWDAVAFFNQIGPGCATLKYAPGAKVFRQGDAADAVYYIKKGRVQIGIVSKQGKHGVIGMLTKGDFFGESCLAGQPTQIATASAMTDSEIVKIERATMARMLTEQPKLAQVVLSFMLTRNIQVEADIIDHLFNSSEKRLARVLLLLANFGKTGKLEEIPKISQEDLAARVGTTRSRINFFLNKFRKLGLIEYNGTLRVHSALLNVIVHD